MSLSLNCIFLGDDRVFTIDIPKTAKVSVLQKLIKEDNPSSLHNIDVKNIDLWHVSFPLDDLGTTTKLENINLDDYQRLVPHKKITAFFTDVADDLLHVIVKVPDAQTAVALDPTQLFSLNYFILGDDPNQYFIVDIPKTASVGALQKLIKEDNPSSLHNVDVKNIAMWSISFPIDDLPSKNPPAVGPKLRVEKTLSDVFPSKLDTSCIHVVVRVPGQGPPSPSSGPLPSAYKAAVTSLTPLGQDRHRFLSQRKSEVPSNGGNPQTFLSNQNKEDTYIPCNRPYGSHTAFPLSLLHPIFGAYVDDAENYVPTPDDVQFFLAFKGAMANIYKKENERQNTLLDIFEDHNMSIKPMGIGKFMTDGDLSAGRFRFLIAEIKNEIGSSATEPFFQAILYFLEATRTLAPGNPNSVLPCIIVLVFGPYVAFAGAAWTDRPTVQMLSSAIPCHYQNTDIKMESMLMGHLGALRRAINSLDAYYQEYRNGQSARCNARYPYPTCYKSQDGSERHFIYISHLKGRNLFFGHMCVDDTPICIKFVPRYCQKGHEFLAAKGLAPTLRAVQRLPGGLYMVVMDDVSEKYTSLFNYIQGDQDLLSDKHASARNSFLEKVRHCLQQFHEAGFVHGDMRDTNIMVNKGGFDDGPFLVVDFDYCGNVNEVRYPLDLNTTSIRRPQGATGGAVIKMEHDMDMLDYIWVPQLVAIV